MDYKGSVNRMNSKIKSDKTRVGTSWRVNELTSKQVVRSVSVTGSPSFSHLFANRFPPVPAFLFHVFRILFSRIPHSFLTCCASLTHVYKVSFIVVRHEFHHGDTIISPWWENSFTMVKLTKDTEGKNIRRMGKEQETREKECGNLLDKERKQGSRARIFIQNLPLLTLETTWHQMWI